MSNSIQRVQKIFQALDTNNSGSLSRCELVDLFMHTPGASEMSLIFSVDRLFDQAVGNHRIEAVTISEFVGLFTEFEKREGTLELIDCVEWFESMLPFIPNQWSNFRAPKKTRLPPVVGKSSGKSQERKGPQQRGSSSGRVRVNDRMQQQQRQEDEEALNRPNTAVRTVAGRAEARRAQWKADKAKGLDPRNRMKQLRKGVTGDGGAMPLEKMAKPSISYSRDWYPESSSEVQGWHAEKAKKEAAHKERVAALKMEREQGNQKYRNTGGQRSGSGDDDNFLLTTGAQVRAAAQAETSSTADSAGTFDSLQYEDIRYPYGKPPPEQRSVRFGTNPNGTVGAQTRKL